MHGGTPFFAAEAVAASNHTVWTLTRDPEFADEHGIFGFTVEAYGAVVLLTCLLTSIPAGITVVGSAILADTGVWKPKWLHRSWATQSDAYRLLLQEIYSAHPVRFYNCCVGAMAIAMQALVLLLIGMHLFGWGSAQGQHTEYIRLPGDDAPVLGLEGRCVAFLIVSIRILQGDTKRDWKMMRYAAEHPGPLAGNACAFAIGTIGCTMGLTNACLGAVLIVRAESILKVLTTFAGLAYLFDIDNWFVNLFELDSNDLKWLEPLPPDGSPCPIKQYNLLAVNDPEAPDGAHHAPRLSASLLTITRKVIFFGIYPAVFFYLFLFWIPARSMPRDTRAAPGGDL